MTLFKDGAIGDVKFANSIEKSLKEIAKNTSDIASQMRGEDAVINEFNKAEFLGEIIDVFEDFLEGKEVEIINKEKTEDEEDTAAIIYGTDYGHLQDEISKICRAFNLWE